MTGYPDMEKRQKVLDLRATGMTYAEIAQVMGYKNNSWVSKVCKEHGLNRTAREIRYEKYREYKRQGHTVKEVADKFGISETTAITACRGVAPQLSIKKGDHPSWVRNKYTVGEDREVHAKRVIESRVPQFEYVGGFTNGDASVDIRCKVCGHVQTRSMSAIRHRKIACSYCRAIEIQKREEAQLEEKRAKEREKEERQKQAIKEKERLLEERRHPCPVCGKETTRKTYCSDECCRKLNDQIREVKRRAKLKEALVDKDITLQALFCRENGVCYLCGGLCDWDDKEERDGIIICGNNYPSIDHVVPLVKGGKHEWKNIRLAHRLCNSKKSSHPAPSIRPAV